jgi:hypothetical protein
MLWAINRARLNVDPLPADLPMSSALEQRWNNDKRVDSINYRVPETRES